MGTSSTYLRIVLFRISLRGWAESYTGSKFTKKLKSNLETQLNIWLTFRNIIIEVEPDI